METRNIGDLLKTLTKDKTVISYPSLVCTVTSVDKNANTCDVQPQGDVAEFFDVPLTQDGSKRE